MRCAAEYEAGAIVTLSAIPDATSTFTEWVDNPDCDSARPCRVPVDVSRDIEVAFQRITHRVSVELPTSNTGAAAITSTPAGIQCPPICEADFETGARVELTAEPDPNSYFARWTGACAGSSNTCELNPLADETVEAHAHQAPVELALGFEHSCARFGDGTMRCWGAGQAGQLGYGTQMPVGDDPTRSVASAGPVPVGEAVSSIAAGEEHTCATTVLGRVRCWGSGGALGYGSMDSVGAGLGPTPTINSAGDVPLPMGVVASSVAAGDFASCVVDRGAARCWGDARLLGLGLGTNMGDGTGPGLEGMAPINLGTTVAQIALGWEHVCARSMTGSLRCWGSGLDGRLGYGDEVSVGGAKEPMTHQTVDVPVGAPVQQVVVGLVHTCALVVGGAVRCWGKGGPDKPPSVLGYGVGGNVGDGGRSIVEAGDVPIGEAAVELAAGFFHTCTRLVTGVVRCWGSGELSGHGEGSPWIGNEPGQGGISIVGAGDVPLPAPARHIAAGAYHTCAILSDGATVCWGENHAGQLGTDTTTNVFDASLVTKVQFY